MTDFIPETREEIDKAGMSVYEFSADNVKILAIEIEDMDDMDDDSSEQCRDDYEDSIAYEQDTYEHYSGDYS